MDIAAAEALVAAAAAGAAGEVGRRAWDSLTGLVGRVVGRAEGADGAGGGLVTSAGEAGEIAEAGDAGDAGDIADGVIDCALPDPGDEDAVRALTGQVIEGLRADTDGRFAEALQQWADAHRAELRVHSVDNSSATNVIAGDARVSGPVIQVGGDVHGGINLG